MTPIPPPGRRPKRPADRAMMVAIAIVALIGMILGWIIRDVAVRAAPVAIEPSIEPEPMTPAVVQPTARPEQPDSELEEPEPEQEPEEPGLISLGTYTITAYCPCEICCGKWSNPDNPITASGAPAVEGVTVASDWQTLPKGTEIYIDGVGSRTVQDKPAKWIVEKYDGKIIDLYFESHEDAWNWGKQELEVWTYDQAMRSLPSMQLKD